MDQASNLIGRINVGDSLTRTAATRPAQLAVVDGDRRFSYAEFNAYVNRLAHGLSGLGLRARRRPGPGLGQQRRLPGRLLRLCQARRGLRADQPGLAARRGGLRAGPLARPRHRRRSPAGPGHAGRHRQGARGPRRDHRAGHRCRGRAGARRPGLDHHRGPDRPRPRRGAGALRRRPGRAELPLHLGHHLVPQGRGRLPPGHLPRVDVRRARLRLEFQRPVRRR